METLRYLIGFFLKLAFSFFVFAIVWWVASLLVPSLSFRTLIPTILGTEGEKHDLLPSPKLYQGLFSKNASQERFNVYQHGAAFDGYGINGKNVNGYSYSNSNVAYITYTSTGTQVSNNGVYDQGKGVVIYPQTQQPTTSGADVGRSVYVRNLSMYGGQAVSTGFSFIGEARSTMFRNGIFPVVLIDANRRVIGVSTARAQGDWTVPGWSRFEVTVRHAVPSVGSCMFVFEQALTDQERAAKIEPVRMPINVACK